MMIRHAQDFAKMILERLSHVITQDEQVDLATQPLSPLKSMSAALPSLDISTYFYGILDCARQLSKVIEQDGLPLAFPALMTRIIVKAKEPRFRWKAVSFLRRDTSPLSDPI